MKDCLVINAFLQLHLVFNVLLYLAIIPIASFYIATDFIQNGSAMPLSVRIVILIYLTGLFFMMSLQNLLILTKTHSSQRLRTISIYSKLEIKIIRASSALKAFILIIPNILSFCFIILSMNNLSDYLTDQFEDVQVKKHANMFEAFIQTKSLFLILIHCFMVFLNYPVMIFQLFGVVLLLTCLWYIYSVKQYSPDFMKRQRDLAKHQQEAQTQYERTQLTMTQINQSQAQVNRIRAEVNQIAPFTQMKLPKKVIEQEMQPLRKKYGEVNKGKNAQVAKECSVCLEQFKKEAVVVQMRCNPNQHIFHYGCALEWFQQKPNCPLCRFDLIKKIQEPLDSQRVLQPYNSQTNLNTEAPLDPNLQQIENSNRRITLDQIETPNRQLTIINQESSQHPSANYFYNV